MPDTTDFSLAPSKIPIQHLPMDWHFGILNGELLLQIDTPLGVTVLRMAPDTAIILGEKLAGAGRRLATRAAEAPTNGNGHSRLVVASPPSVPKNGRHPRAR